MARSDPDSSVRVYLIGGAPGAGKTTLACALAARLGAACVSVDDLVTAAHAVTTPDSHPGLHCTSVTPHLEYFTNGPLEKLQADANAQHAAAWPLVERVVRKHATWAGPIVIDGWHIRPADVARLGLDNVWAGWIVCDPTVLDERERNNTEWMEGSEDPERMLRHFLGRSRWFNALVEEEAAAHGMNILRQPGTASVEDLCALVLT